MYTRFSSRALETCTKSYVYPPRLVVHSRGFGSTGSTSSVAVLHKTSNIRTEPVINTPEDPKKHYRAYAQGPRRGQVEQDRNLRVKQTYGGSKQDDNEPPREVHIASKVKQLCGAGQLDEAVEYCKNAPTALQGPVAWNTIIKCALDEKRYNFAFELYVQMKKRAIRPTLATYSTFLFAYAQASPEILTSIQLERAQKIYKDWVNLASAPHYKPTGTPMHPAAAYINVLANAKLYQSIWDTFYELNLEGSLAPDEFVFTSMFIAFTKRDASSLPTTSHEDSSSASTSSDNASSPQVRNAQNPKLLWRMTLQAHARKPFPLDSHLLTAVLRALQSGGQAELELGLSIINDYVGLRIPDKPAPSTDLVNPDLVLNFRLLDAALVICNLAKRPDLTRHIVEALMDPQNPRRSSISTGSMNHLLAAYVSLGDMRKVQKTIGWMLREGAVEGGLEVMPGSSTWCLAFRACLDARDWGAAKALTKLLAGTVNNKRTIDVETIYLVLKSTYVLKPDDERLHERQLRQALDAVYYVVALWPRDAKGVHGRYAQINPARAERRLVFQNALGDLVKTILNEFDGLSSIAVFHDLAFRLDRLRNELPKEVVARYEREI